MRRDGVVLFWTSCAARSGKTAPVSGTARSTTQIAPLLMPTYI